MATPTRTDKSPVLRPITSDDPESRSADIVAENVEQLRTLFPEAVTEDGIDFDVLKQLLGGAVAEGDEKYGLNWHGKRQTRQLALTPSTGTLLPRPEESVDWDTTKNLVIEGDNLEVLKLLQKSYAAKVKLIYIDPPYNTGKDFVYKDDYRDNLRNYLEVTGQIDGEGRRVSSNTEASGRFHTDWLSMVYPRLKLARHLLSDDGVIFISIDDNEVDNIRRVCDEIFGEENRLAIICHKARASVSNDKIISSNHNFVVLYARNAAAVFEERSHFGLSPDLDGFDRQDERGPFKFVPVDGPGGAAKGNPYYTFLGVTGYFRFSEERMRRMYEMGLIAKVGNGLQQKYYLEEAKQSRKTDTTWWDDGYYTSTASSRLKALMGGDVFDSPKPVELVRRMLELWVRSPNDVVLDFFAGSGTTGQAVLEQSVGDAIPRSYILVQLPEPLDPEDKDQSAAAEYCDRIGRPRQIAELTKERLRRAADNIRAANPNTAADTGFRVFRLATTNFSTWLPNPEALSESLLAGTSGVLRGCTEEDLLYELLLKLGLELTIPIQQRVIAGKNVQAAGGGVLLTCLADQITGGDVESVSTGIAEWHKELAPVGETQVVVRDSAFADDVAKTNFVAILQQHGLENVRSI